MFIVIPAEPVELRQNSCRKMGNLWIFEALLELSKFRDFEILFIEYELRLGRKYESIKGLINRILSQ